MTDTDRAVAKRWATVVMLGHHIACECHTCAAARVLKELLGDKPVLGASGDAPKRDAES